MEDKRLGPENRKSERIGAAFNLTYSVEKPYALRVSLGVADGIEAIMLDLSELGMAIITKYDLPIGTQLHVKFNIIDLHLTGEERRRHMELPADIVSNVFIPKSSHRIGVRFSRISDEDRRAIRDFVKRNKFPS